MTDKMITCWKMENVGTKHISTIRTFFAEGSIQCIVQQSNHLSIKNETKSTTAFTAVFTVTVGSSIMSIHMLFYSLMISEQYVVSVYLGIRMCKDDPFNHIALHFSNYDQYHHQFRWLTFDFPATNDISHVCLWVGTSRGSFTAN